jgi:predicted nucleotidyltransferase
MALMLDQVQIEEAFRALGEEALAGGHHVELFVVGGAVMVWKFRSRLSTKDVDAVILGPAPASLVRTMIERVAVRLGWPTDWLNDGAKGYVGSDIEGELLFAAPGITVRIPPLAQMLALKLSAWRDDVDMADAETILGAMTGPCEEVWTRVVVYLPRGQELKAQYAFEQLWETSHGNTT